MLRRRTLLALLSATALLRLAHLLAVRDAPFVGQLALDSQEYDRWARAIAAGDWLGSAPFFQAPLYPYLVALVYRFVPLAAAAPLAVYLLQIAVAVVGCWALVRAGEALAGPRAAGATGLLFALYTPFWFYDVQLMKESFAVSAVCLLLLLLVKARALDRSVLWFSVGLVAAFLALLRENMLLVVPFLLLLTWREKTGKEWLWALRRCGLLLLGLSLPLLVVAARNAALGGGFLPTAPIARWCLGSRFLPTSAKGRGFSPSRRSGIRWRRMKSPDTGCVARSRGRGPSRSPSSVCSSPSSGSTGTATSGPTRWTTTG